MWFCRNSNKQYESNALWFKVALDNSITMCYHYSQVVENLAILFKEITMEKKKILFQFTNGFGFELVPADTEEDAWLELEKLIGKDESVDDYELVGGIE